MPWSSRRILALATAAVVASTLGACGASHRAPYAAPRTPYPSGVMPVAGPSQKTALHLNRPIRASFRPPARRPNLLMITVDDAAWADMPYMKTLQKTLAAHGTTLTDGISPTPLCVPARASLLSGQYATNDHARAIDGEDGGYAAFDEAHTLPVWLQDAGYRTYFVGKYLNGYGENGSEHDVPPGWTDWNASVDPTTYSFMNETFDRNGTVTTMPGYITDVDSDLSNRLIAQQQGSAKPWYMWVNYVAPHQGGGMEPGDPTLGCAPNGSPLRTTRPAPRDEGTFAHLQLPREPDMFEKNTSDKVLVSQVHVPVSKACRAVFRYAHEQRVEALQDVDRALGRTLDTLRRTGQLAHTEVVFTSDNGFALGEHNLSGKLWYFRDILSVPMYIMGPGVPAGKKSRLPVSNADWAPTFAALAGARITGLHPDGSNIFPYLSTDAAERIIPIAAWGPNDGTRAKYTGVTVGEWTYVRRGKKEEAYDRAVDPYELNNVAHDPRYRSEVARLRRLTRRYADCAAETCSHAFYR